MSSDERLNRSDFPVDMSVITNFKGQKFLDEQTLHQSPSPLAFSTVAQNRKLSSKMQEEEDFSFIRLSHKSNTGSEITCIKQHDALADVSTHPLRSSIAKKMDKEIAKTRKSMDGSIEEDSSLGLLSMENMADYSFGEASMSATSFRSFHQSKRDVRLQSILEESMSSTKSEPVMTNNHAANDTNHDDGKDVVVEGKCAISLRYLMPIADGSLTAETGNDKTDIADKIYNDWMKEASLRERLDFDETGNYVPFSATNNRNDIVSDERQGDNSSMNVDFRDDQISARSSSLGSSQRTVGTTCADTLFSNIFRKYSLGASFFRDDPQWNHPELPSYLRADDCVFDSRKDRSSSRSKDTASTVKAAKDLAGPSSSVDINGASNSKDVTANGRDADSPLDVLGGSLPFVGEDVKAEFRKINLHEEFANADDFHKGLDAAEEECVKEHRFLQEEPMDGENDRPNSSWMFNASAQDITRPSWMNSLPDEDNLDLGTFPDKRRVTAGQLFMAKTEALGTLDGENCDSATKRPTFGIVPPSNRKTAESKVKRETVSVCEPKVKAQRVIEQHLGHDAATPSRSFLPMDCEISEMIRNASLGNDTATMAQLALQLLQAEKRNARPNPAIGPNSENGGVATATVPPSVRPKETLQNRRSSRSVVPTRPLLAQTSTARLQNEAELSGGRSWCLDTACDTSNSNDSVADLTLVASSSPDYPQSVAVDTTFIGPSHCCVGTTATFRIAVHNHSNKLHRGRLVMNMMLLDGNDQSSDASSADVDYPSAFTLEPRYSEIIKVDFTARKVGDWSLTFGFNVFPSEECAKPMTIVKSVDVIVVTPQVEAKPAVLHFGEIPTGCCCSREMFLYSANEASIPVKVSIEASSYVNCSAFYFPKNSQLDGSVKVISLNSILCEIPANLENEKRGIKIVVALRTESTTGPDELKMETCNVRVELASSESNVVLTNVKLKAVVGAIRLHTNVRSEPIILTASYPSPALVKVALKNSSKIPLAITLGYVGNSANFFVSTQEMTMNSQQRDDVALIFRPNSGASETEIMESTLRIQVQPDGPVFDMKVVGKMERLSGTRRELEGRVQILDHQHRVGTPPSPPVKGDSNDCLKRTDKEATSSGSGVWKVQLAPERIVFADTKCGSSSVQKLKVSNKSSKDVKLTLLPPEEMSFIVSHTDLVCKAMHYLSVKIYFKPKAVGSFRGRVVVLLSRDGEDTEMEASLQGLSTL